MTSPLNWQDFLKAGKLPADAGCLHSPQQQHALVRVTGKDAESFLHAQLSNSVINLSVGDVRFAAWCNAKGRVWTLVRYWRDGDAIILRMPVDQMEDTVKRLRMFVLRSDVQLEPMDWQAIQFLGPDAEVQAKQCAAAASSRAYNIPLPGAWPLHEVWNAALPSSDLPELPASLLALPRVLAGIPEVFANQREAWIPQMLNLDKLNGIDFKKGCYPGQEIVAKLHYKGGLKQRMYVGAIDNTNPISDSVIEITDAEGKKLGNTLEATPLEGRIWLTLILRLDSVDMPLRIADKPVTLISS